MVSIGLSSIERVFYGLIWRNRNEFQSDYGSIESHLSAHINILFKQRFNRTMVVLKEVIREGSFNCTRVVLKGRIVHQRSFETGL